MRGAGGRAFTSSLLKKKLAPNSSSASYLFSRLFLRFHATVDTEAEKRSSSILGPDLPDIWTPLSSTVPPCTSPGGGVNHDAPPTIIDGKSIAEEIRSEISKTVRNLKSSYGKVPGLAVILVGQRRDSQSYVRYKIKACNEVGIRSLVAQLPDSCSDEEVVEYVRRFNDDPSVHGILVQLPLPPCWFDSIVHALHELKTAPYIGYMDQESRVWGFCNLHMDEERILGAISLEKDVDGFHPLNVGNLALRARQPLFIPCAAKACVGLLLRYRIDLMGKHAVVIGRSKVVGLPTSLLLQRHHATVSIVHAYTPNPEEITREADIVISAAGVANLVRGSWLKRGAVVIDVGTNPIEDSDSEHGYRLTGDVHFDEAVKLASAITPVPGGVGPVTIAMLLSNTLDAFRSSA